VCSAVQREYDLAPEDVSGAKVRVVDIRGTRLPAAVTPVLSDPSGVRARRLARAGRAIAFLCLLWLVGLGLAGIGILPADDLPLGRAITGGASGPLRVAPRPTPSRSDPAGGQAKSLGRASAVAERVAHTRPRAQLATPDVHQGTSRRESESSAVGRSPARSTTRRADPGVSGPASAARGTGTPGASVAAPNGARSGPSQSAGAGVSNRGINATGRGIATAPGTTVRSATPGHTGTTARGNSRTAPGQVSPTGTTVIPAPGQSGSAPGHTVTMGGGHGNGT
jgi:hypothetical protein